MFVPVSSKSGFPQDLLQLGRADCRKTRILLAKREVPD